MNAQSEVQEHALLLLRNPPTPPPTSTLPSLILRHIDVPASNVTIVTSDDRGRHVAEEYVWGPDRSWFLVEARPRNRCDRVGQCLPSLADATAVPLWQIRAALRGGTNQT
jgi:hypothetical protein